MKKKVYNNYSAQKILKKSLPIARQQLVNKFSQVKIRAPLVLKIISNDALHKTEIGGVRIVHDQSQVQDEFNDLLMVAAKKRLKIDGILVQEFVEGEQLIIGIKKDPAFGHVVLFGLGGIFTEVLEDISIRKCPITKQDAQEMIDDLKAKKIFYGFRGKKLNVNLLKDVLVNVSKLPIKYKSMEEMDINPFILNEDVGIVVDARIVMSK